jgi:hypothetical protein
VSQRRGFFALLCGLALVVPASAQDKADLKWKLEKGKTFFQTMTTKTKQTMKVQGTEVIQNQDQTFYFQWTVHDVKDGEVIIKQKIIGLKMSIDIGGSKINFDSTSKQDNTNNPLAKFFQALNNNEFTLTLSTKDVTKGIQVTKIEGQEQFRKNLIGANPQMEALLKNILSDQALKEMAEPTFNALPNKEVTKGEAGKWTRKSELSMGPIGKYETTYTYTYEGKEKNLDKISVSTDLKYTPPTEKESVGLPFKIKDATLKSKSSSGTLLFDPAKGWVVSSDTKLTIEGSLTIEIGGQGTKVDLTQEQETKVTTEEKNPITPPK